MQWSETVKEYVSALKSHPLNGANAERLVSLMDLTSLNAGDTQSSVAAFLEKANSPYGPVAAVCVLPPFVRLVRDQFAGSSVRTATVANFPEGNASLESVLLEIASAISDGAEEVDVVFPYHRYLAGERQYAETFVSLCKEACGDKVLLKVILETGVLNDPAIIADASYDALKAGADFIKTSTGKLPEGATLSAAATMLLVVKHIMPQLKRPVGVKVAGGIKSAHDAIQYVELADNILGRELITSQTFRIGASKLLDEIIQKAP